MVNGAEQPWSTADNKDQIQFQKPYKTLFISKIIHSENLNQSRFQEMIHLLFAVIFAEMVLIMALLFKTPLRQLVIMGLDRVKRGRGSVVAKTVGGTVFVVLLSTLQGMAVIQDNTLEGGIVNPTDQVLMARHMLEASLMGFLLFLALVLDRLHHYMRELRVLRKIIATGKRQNSGFESTRSRNSNETNVAEEEISALKRKIKQLQSECGVEGEELGDTEAETCDQIFRNRLDLYDQGLLNM